MFQWAHELVRLHARLAPRFARREPHRRVLKYLQGILSDTARKNGWQLAEYAGEARPDGMQRLLSHSVWDTEGVRDDLRTYVLSRLGRQGAIGVLDETSFPRRGCKSAGVAVQSCGTSGQVENCQAGVFLGYVTKLGHALMDRELSGKEPPRRPIPEEFRGNVCQVPDSTNVKGRADKELVEVSHGKPTDRASSCQCPHAAASDCKS